MLLSFSGEKRVAVLPHEPTGDLTDIVQQAKTLFVDLAGKDTGDICVRSFDEDFEEWVDLDPSFVAKSKEKVQVALRQIKVSNILRTLDRQ